MRMELRQIYYFVAIAEVEHFGRAAQQLRIAQPALSRQMKLLEAEMGVALFERLPRGVRLTEAGRTFLNETRGLQAQLARAVDSARAAAAGRHGALRLGFIEAAAWHGLVPDALRLFRARFPGIELSLSSMATEGQLAALRQGTLDGALVYNPAPADDLITVALARHPVVLAVPENSPLAAQENVLLADLADRPLIGFQRRASPRFYDDVHARFRAAGVLPQYIAELTVETDILALVSAGAGIALVNSSQKWRPPHAVRFVDVADLGVSLELALVHTKDGPTPTLHQFATMLSALGAG